MPGYNKITSLVISNNYSLTLVNIKQISAKKLMQFKFGEFQMHFSKYPFLSLFFLLFLNLKIFITSVIQIKFSVLSKSHIPQNLKTLEVKSQAFKNQFSIRLSMCLCVSARVCRERKEIQHCPFIILYQQDVEI